MTWLTRRMIGVKLPSMAEDGFRSMRVKSTSRAKMDRLRERLLALGERVPERFYTTEAKGMEPGSLCAAFDVVCELAGAKLDELEKHTDKRK